MGAGQCEHASQGRVMNLYAGLVIRCEVDRQVVLVVREYEVSLVDHESLAVHRIYVHAEIRGHYVRCCVG